MLLQQDKPDPHNVRKHHAKDLLAFVKTQQRAGALVAVMGDFNDTIGDDNTGLTKLCSECGLQDIVFHKHRHSARSFISYAGGSTCIDYMLLDPELADAVQA